MQYSSKQHLLEINNEIQSLKKGKMSGNEYAAAFTEKMNLVMNLVLTKLSKVNMFTIGLPMHYGPTMKLATTMKAIIWAVKNVET